MKPVNQKSLLAFLFDQMEKLDRKEIDVQTASAQANLAKQVNNVISLELKRADVQMKLNAHNKEYAANVEIRQVESKAFDSAQAD